MFSRDTMYAFGNMMIGAGISSMIWSCIMIYIGKNYYITMTKKNKNDNINCCIQNDNINCCNQNID